MQPSSPSANWTNGREDAEVGTQDWADSVRSHLVHRAGHMGSEEEHFSKVLDTLKKHEAWRLLTKPDGSFFGSLDEFIAFRRPYGLGVEVATLKPYLDAAHARSQNHLRVPLSSIRRDGGTQSRAQLDDATVAEYAERLAELPPVTVYHDGDAYWLADGFHRVAAHERAGAAEVLCDVRQGSRRDAVLHSVGANSKHGLPRSNKDKRRAVEMLLTDEEWVQRGDDWIAEKCAVTDKTVTKARHDLEATSEIPKLTYRIGRDGKKRNLPSPPAPPPKTRSEKRAAVEKALRDPKLRDLSNRQIAERCGVHHQLVSQVRQELEAPKSSTSGAKSSTPETSSEAPSSAESAHSAHPSHESSEYPRTHGEEGSPARGPNFLGQDPDDDGEVCQPPDPRQVDMFEAAPALEPAAPPAQLPGLSAEAREVRIRLRALPMDQRRAIHALEREELTDG